MTTGTGEQLVSDYLERLRSAATVLPVERRAELVEEIGEHLASARAAGELGDEAAARTLLDRLGAPEEIVAAARDDVPAGHTGGSGPPPWGPPRAGGWAAPPAPPPTLVPPSTTLETFAVLMLTVGSLIPVVGWLVGVALLWTSRRWRPWEKALGTLVVPGGPGILLPLSAFAGLTTQTCSVSATVGSGEGSVPELAIPAPPPGPVPMQPAPPPSLPQSSTEPPPFPPPELVPPSGGVMTVETCTGTVLPWPVLLATAVVAVVGPVLVAVFLLRRARARAAQEPPVQRAARSGGGSPWGGLEIVAVVLLAIGPFLAPVVASAVAVVLVWCSPQWSSGEKAVGTALALVPAALLAAGFLLSFLGLAALALGVVGLFLLSALGSVAAAIYLAVVLSRRG